MSEDKMYSQRAANIPVMRFCEYRCSYCAFQKFQKISSCSLCRDNVNHAHLEALQRRPPETKKGVFLTVGLSGDVSFMSVPNFAQTLLYCAQWRDRTFLIQSKNPEYFVQFSERNLIPDNVILGTTIESDGDLFLPEYLKEKYPLSFTRYEEISKAPYPKKRYEAMLKLNCRTAITIEPILDFDIDRFEKMILSKHWDFVYIGYANDGKEGKRLRLPEPELQKAHAFIDRLRRNCYGTEIRIKTLRPAWYEGI